MHAEHSSAEPPVTLAVEAQRLLADASYAIGLIGSPFQPIDVLARSENLPPATARRFLNRALATVYRRESSSSAVYELPPDDGLFGIAAYISAGRRRTGLLLYTRRRQFTATEIATVEGALPLLQQALQHDAAAYAAAFATKRLVPMLCVLRSDLSVEQASETASEVLGGAVGQARLPQTLENRVRAAIADWRADIARCATKVIAADDERHAIRIFLLAASDGPRIALLWEPLRRETPIMRAVERYGLTMRELQILTFIAEGCSSAEIATRLGIVESTVNEHIGRMLQKTHTTNRVELVARTMVSFER